MNEDKKTNSEFDIIGIASLAMGLFYLAAKPLMFFNNIAPGDILFCGSIPLMILGLGVLSKKKIFILLLRVLFIILLIPSIIYFLFYVGFLVVSPVFLFFEGASGIKMFIALAISIIFMIWAFRRLGKYIKT